MWPVWMWIVGWPLEVLIIIGNGLVIYLVASRPRLRTATNCFVLSLAVADFSTAALFPVLTLSSECDIGKPCAHYIASFVAHAASSYFVYVSSTSLCALTFDRFLAIVQPFRYVTFMTKKRIVSIISVAWCVPVVIVFIPQMTLEFVDFSAETYHDLNKYLWFLLSSYDILLLVGLVVTTGKILHVARRHSQQDAAMARQLSFNHGTSARNYRTPESAAFKMITTLVVVFVACYTLHIVNVFGHLGYLQQTLTSVAASILLVMLNSAANPFVYAFFKREIRAELRQLIRCGRPLQQSMDLECVQFRPNMKVVCLSEQDKHQAQGILEASV